jgi:hypothetical protein
MIDNYFDYVVNNLTIEDMEVLGIIYDEGADASFKALKNQELYERSGFTTATYRRITARLNANKFIETVSIQKHHAFYITQFGIEAVHKSLEEVGV